MKRRQAMSQQEKGSHAVHHQGRIHPVIMYPFTQPDELHDLEALYDRLVRKLKDDKTHYVRPLTIINQQTFYRNKRWQPNQRFTQFVEGNLINEVSDIEYTWSVDTCQMWLAGLGRAFHKTNDSADTFWLIPGDFNYASDAGEWVLKTLEKLPSEVNERQLSLCLGEISVAPNSSKQLIDTYGTYGLLYNWFPAAAQAIKKFTEKPRTEFFAISYSYLRDMLDRRWYPYEQMLIMLLEAARAGKIERQVAKISLGDISDQPQGRDTLSAAMQQVERTERVLKLYWREICQAEDNNWPDRFRQLDAQSEEIRDAALIILEQILRG